MKAKIILVVLVSIVLLSCQSKWDVVTEGILSTKLDSLFNTVPDFSGVVLIADKGHPIYHKAFGYRYFETKEAQDTASVFELASVTKQFTAMIIMMLREDGKLEYDDLVEKYIPGLPYQGITIRHLLNHTSGLPDYQAVMDQHWDKTKIAGNNDNIDYLKKYKPAKLFEPGSKYEYSNTGYMLLASIAEKVSGKDFIQLSRENIFIPLSMTSTDIRTKAEKQELKNIAWGHLYVPEKHRYVHADSFPQFNYTIWLGNRKGPGRISSTSSDLLKWDRALYSENLVKRETLEEAFKPARLNNDSLSYYGFGWSIVPSTPLGKMVHHSGDNPGYKTHIIRYINADKTVILLCNNGHEKFDAILNDIVREIKRSSK